MAAMPGTPLRSFPDPPRSIYPLLGITLGEREREKAKEPQPHSKAGFVLYLPGHARRSVGRFGPRRGAIRRQTGGPGEVESGL